MAPPREVPELSATVSPSRKWSVSRLFMKHSAPCLNEDSGNVRAQCYCDVLSMQMIEGRCQGGEVLPASSGCLERRHPGPKSERLPIKAFSLWFSFLPLPPSLLVLSYSFSTHDTHTSLLHLTGFYSSVSTRKNSRRR